MNYSTLDKDHKLPVEAVIRAPVFEVLDDGPVDRRELEARLDISRTTCHRIVRSFEDWGLVTRTDNGYDLTSLGYTVWSEVKRFTGHVETATRLKPLLEGLNPADIEYDLGLFTDSKITRPDPENPYPPINRFMELLRKSTTLRSLDKTSIAPLYVEEIAQLVVDNGLAIEAIYGTDVVKRLLSEYRAELEPAFKTGRCEFRVHDDLSFGLSIFDERIGVRAYDPTSGAYTIFVDTGAPDAYVWAEEVFESYRAEAQPLGDAGEFPGWAKTRRST